MEKAAVFIDVGYLNKILRNVFSNSQVDYLKLSERVCREVNANRLRTYVYQCLPFVRKDNKSDEARHSEMQKFLSKLKRLPRFEVKLGRLQLIGGKFKQKMIDVLISLDIVDMCYDEQIEHVVLIAGDADFVPAIKSAKDHGAIVHLFYHQSSAHNELLDEVDELHIFSKSFIESCKLEYGD